MHVYLSSWKYVIQNRREYIIFSKLGECDMHSLNDNLNTLEQLLVTNVHEASPQLLGYKDH